MFKHSLIPNDGSEVSGRAVRAGMELAAEVGAKVTGYHVQEPVPPHLHGELHVSDRALVTRFDKHARAHAEECIKALGDAAKAAGVSFQGLIEKHPVPYKAILDAARKRKCDAIFIGSHGRRGLSGLILGSVTQKVLTHSKIPVLVFR
jgi:nucleotide-binding universal stress UspA family protein